MIPKIKKLETKIDGIIEKVTNENGTAIKFSDGTMICTKLLTAAGIDVNTASGSLYLSAEIPLGNYAVTFIDEPCVNISKTGGLAAFIYNQRNRSKSSPGTLIIARTETAASQSFVFHITAIGRWK